MNEIVYFELNNWCPGDDYPNAEPYHSWLNPKDHYFIFRDTKYIKENKLIVVEFIIDQSINYCISAPKQWVKQNCPSLLTKYTEFLRYPDEDGCVYSKFGIPFRTWNEKDIGYYYEDY